MEKRSNYPKHEGYEPEGDSGKTEFDNTGHNSGYNPETTEVWTPPRTLKYPPAGGSSKVEVNVTLDYAKKPMKLYKATLSLSKNTGWATESNIEIVYCVAKGLDEAKDMIMKRFSELPKVKGYFIKFVSIEILAQETPDSLSNLLVMYP